MPNGIYNFYATTTPVSTGAANTFTRLLDKNLAAGGVDDGNALLIRAEFEGSGTPLFKINGVDLLMQTNWPTMNGSSEIVQLEVWRVGRYGAMVRPWVACLGLQGVDEMVLRHGGRYIHSAGFDWQTQQAIEVFGRSSIANGLTLARAGLMK